jgi:hypothetical protein
MWLGLLHPGVHLRSDALTLEEGRQDGRRYVQPSHPHGNNVWLSSENENN